MLSAKVKKHEKEENKKSKVKHSKDTQNNMEFPCELCPIVFGLIQRKSASATPDHLLIPKSNQFAETILTKPKSPTKFKPLPTVLPPQHHAASLSLPVGFPLQPKFSQSFSYPIQGLHLPICEHCGWQSSCGTHLVKHKKAVHGDFSNPFEVYKQSRQ